MTSETTEQPVKPDGDEVSNDTSDTSAITQDNASQKPRPKEKELEIIVPDEITLRIKSKTGELVELTLTKTQQRTLYNALKKQLEKAGK
jgi:hypothetical protein